MKEKHVEITEIWQPVKEGGEAVMDGKNLKLVALLAGGQPLWLSKGFVAEKLYASEEQAKNMKENLSA